MIFQYLKIFSLLRNLKRYYNLVFSMITIFGHGEYKQKIIDIMVEFIVFIKSNPNSNNKLLLQGLDDFTETLADIFQALNMNDELVKNLRDLIKN